MDGALVGIELRDELHRSERLSGSRRHEEQESLLARGNRPQSTVHGNRLIPPRVKTSPEAVTRFRLKGCASSLAPASSSP